MLDPEIASFPVNAEAVGTAATRVDNSNIVVIRKVVGRRVETW